MMIVAQIEELGVAAFREAIAAVMAHQALQESCTAFAGHLSAHPRPELAIETLEKAAR